MAEEKKEHYVGTTYEDGAVKVEGPLSKDSSNWRTNQIMDEGRVATSVTAENPGQALLKVLTHVINREKRSSGKP